MSKPVPSRAESAPIAGVPSATGRSRFVPSSFQGVRIGPTSAAELERLLADADGPTELPWIRLRRAPSPRRGRWLRLLSAIGLVLARVG